jgi:hypothetical protein
MKHTDFANMYITTCNAINEQLVELEQTVNANPDIELLVDVLTVPMRNGVNNTDTDTIDWAENLSQLIYQICRYDFYNNITSNIHGDWVYELNSFIGNYLLDDFYFKVYQVGQNGLWQAESTESGIQDAKKLVDAAKENIEIYKQVDLKIAARQEILNQLIIGDLS